MRKKCFVALLAALCLSCGAFAAETTVPVLMFHRVNDAPGYPEEISTAQLTDLFDWLWKGTRA